MLVEQLSSEEIVARFSGQTHLLGFSTGKDAIACWLHMRGKIDVVPFYMEFIPRLEFVEVALEYYERFFGVKILRVPNPNMYIALSCSVFQTPERNDFICEHGIPYFGHEDMRDFICESLKLPIKKTFCAIGTKAADNVVRRAQFKTQGAINYSTQTFYPVWDWSIDRMINEFKKAKVKLPFDYRIFGRTFDGIDFRFIEPIRRHFPRDWQKILDMYPLADLEFFRYEKSEAYKRRNCIC